MDGWMALDYDINRAGNKIAREHYLTCLPMSDSPEQMEPLKLMLGAYKHEEHGCSRH